MHNSATPLSFGLRLEMRVGFPFEASSCRWSERGPRDRPERRRSGLAHVVRAQLSFLFFSFLRNATLHVFPGGGVSTDVLTLMRFLFFSLLFFIPNWKRARSVSKKLSQISSGRLKSERWRVLGDQLLRRAVKEAVLGQTTRGGFWLSRAPDRLELEPRRELARCVGGRGR